MIKNKFVISRDLIGVQLQKLDKDTRGYENRITLLTDEELQQKIKEIKAMGLVPEMYHQEEFGDGYRFVRDGEGLDDIKGLMTYKQLKKFMNDCRKEVEKKCRDEIRNGNINLIRSGQYNFDVGIRVFNILLEYAESNFKSIIIFESFLYFVACIGNVYEINEILSMLREKEIYLHFIDCDICTADSKYEIGIEDYIGVLINEYLIDDILFKMHNENQLSDEEFEEYNFTKLDFDENDYGSVEFDEIMEKYSD